MIDEREVRRIERGGGVGAIHMAQHAAEEYERRKMEEATGILLETIQACSLGGVHANGEIREGEPAKELLAAAGGCDLVVAAIASHFDPGLEDKPGRLVLSMMRDGGIPSCWRARRTGRSARSWSAAAGRSRRSGSSAR